MWTEIPLVNAVGLVQDFRKVARTQLTELIRQQYNRPSVCFWGLENEIRENGRNPYYTTKQLLSELDELAHQEDGSGRYTTQAVNRNMAMDQGDPANLADDKASVGWKSDLIGWNIYPGWYPTFAGTFAELTEEKISMESRPMALSEYGWGASVSQHELYPRLNQNGLTSGGKWHPEEYQSLMHEEAVAYINEHPNLWATFIWAMFDFDVDSRNEGSRVAQNDKGLVTNDRSVKKDSFYLYKANWDKRAPFVHITSARYVKRENASTYIKVYSNCDSVALFMNGTALGDMTNQGNGIFLLEDVPLVIGENRVYAVGRMGADTCEDACLWTRDALTVTTLASDALEVDQARRTVAIERLMPLKELREALWGADNATYRIMSNGAEVADDAFVTPDMTAAVTAENGAQTGVYTFISDMALEASLASVTSSDEQYSPENLVDGDDGTAWLAGSVKYPQSITLALDDVYFLNTLTIDWYKFGGRTFTYTVEVSEDGEHFALALDRRDNSISGETSDELRMAKGKYVRINVLSCSQGKSKAAIYEIKVNGWMLSSDAYEIDHVNRLIAVADPEGLAEEELRSHLAASGNCAYRVRAAESIGEGTEVIVTDIRGRDLVYTVTADRQTARYPIDQALFKQVYFSSEEGVGADKIRDTHADNINDGLIDTAWVADTKIGGTPGKRADYPEWIGIDLGRPCDITGIELSFETKGERVYQFEIYISTDVSFLDSANISKDFELIIDCADNADFDGGHYSFSSEEDERMRYIVVKVLGNSLYPRNQYAAAGIYDLKVFGVEAQAEE